MEILGALVFGWIFVSTISISITIFAILGVVLASITNLEEFIIILAVSGGIVGILIGNIAGKAGYHIILKLLM